MPNTHNEAQQAGQAIGSGIGFLFSVIVGIFSLVGGLLGWLLLLNRNVYKCLRCGFILDRA
jgi:tetrahydromethanopterin S-methyltransferase subunit G